eukprot:m.65194 g.65194  ORF g.65194 m.65194 type:complete len:93 (+) comp14027_c0_seq6:1135-1413(+)
MLALGYFHPQSRTGIPDEPQQQWSLQGKRYRIESADVPNLAANALSIQTRPLTSFREKRGVHMLILSRTDTAAEERNSVHICSGGRLPRTPN